VGLLSLGRASFRRLRVICTVHIAYSEGILADSDSFFFRHDSSQFLRVSLIARRAYFYGSCRRIFEALGLFHFIAPAECGF